MAFPRIQGNKILILHSLRKGKKIRHQKLHVFDTFSDAVDVTSSDIKWSLLCDSLELQLKGGSKIKRKQLRKKIMDSLDQIELENESDPIDESAYELAAMLQSFIHPLLPYQKKSLQNAKENLKLLGELIDEKLLLIEREKVMQTYGHNTKQSTMDILHEGLDFYDQGRWDDAKRTFLYGLKIDPNNVDLLVHAGLCELLDENYLFALSYFDKAAEIGKRFIDNEIKNNPDEYIKLSDLDKWASDKICRLADECLDWNTEKCEDCENSPKHELINLYTYLEFRPFFRALANKALALIKLKRFHEAIKTYKLCLEYDYSAGSYNMIGICYLNLGEIEEADGWYKELLWDEAFYVKALIKFVLGRKEDSFKYLLTGVIKNPHIVNMLISKEKPEKTRYVGRVLPDRLEASEFYHENKHIFKRYPGIRNLIRCILEDDAIVELMAILAESKRLWEERTDIRMDPYHWDLLHGNMNDDFLSQHVPRLIEKLNDKASDYWQPEKNDVITIKIIEKKKQNWLVELVGCDEKTLYFRPSYYMEQIQEGDTVRICVSKAWHYRRSLFVSGEIEQ